MRGPTAKPRKMIIIEGLHERKANNINKKIPGIILKVVPPSILVTDNTADSNAKSQKARIFLNIQRLLTLHTVKR